MADEVALLRGHAGGVGEVAPVFDGGDDLGEDLAIAAAFQACNLGAGTEVIAAGSA